MFARDLNSVNLASWTRSSALQYLQTCFANGTRKARDVNHETKLHICSLTPSIVIYRRMIGKTSKLINTGVS